MMEGERDRQRGNRREERKWKARRCRDQEEGDKSMRKRWIDSREEQKERTETNKKWRGKMKR